MEKDKRMEELEKLKQETIVHYLDEIDANSDMDLYDKMLDHLFQGDFDQLLEDSALNSDDRNKILDLARKYSCLCFFQGDINYWADSIEGVYLNDLDLVCLKLLDNYHFLIQLAAEGGEDVLKQLVAFQKTDMASESAIIDYLRNTFYDDDTLKKVLQNISKVDGDYSIFTDEQKSILCTYPDGILYHLTDDNKVNLVSVKELEEKMRGDIINDEEFDFSLLNSYLKSDIDTFEKMILDIYYDYHEKQIFFGVSKK